MTVKFLHLNDFDGGIVTASNSADGHPVSCIKHHWHTRHWRSINAANEWVKVDLEEPKDIEGLVIKYHNFQVGATVRIQAHEDDTHWAGPDLNELLTITSEQIVKLWDPAETFRWWRILMVTAPVAPVTYQRIGRIFLGGIDGLSRTFSHQFFYKLVDPSGIMRSDGGQFSANPKPKFQQMGYTFKGLTTADKLILEGIFNNVGISEAYFFCENVSDLLTFYVKNISSWNIEAIKTKEKKYSLTIDMETLR